MANAVTAAPCYLFGVVAADATLPKVDPAATITDLRLVRSGDLAALVGTPPDRPLGRSGDLVTHDRVLADLVATGTAVLPVRFGSVVADERTLADDLLDANRERYRATLDLLRGRVQYTVRVQYEQDAVLREVVRADPQVARLRESLRERPDPPVDQQVRLGEQVVAALAARRPDDAAGLLAALEPEAVDVHTREPSAPEEVLHAAFLVDRERAASFEAAVERLGRSTHERMRIRLVGPVAGYDFVPGT